MYTIFIRLLYSYSPFSVGPISIENWSKDWFSFWVDPEEIQVASPSLTRRENKELGPSWPNTCERYWGDFDLQDSEDEGICQIILIYLIWAPGITLKILWNECSFVNTTSSDKSLSSRFLFSTSLNLEKAYFFSSSMDWEPTRTKLILFEE